jgi:conjugal transfer/entry exclusion protein
MEDSRSGPSALVNTIRHTTTRRSGGTQAIEQARQAAAQEQAREQFRRFMRGQDYSPSSVRMFHQ